MVLDTFPKLLIHMCDWPQVKTDTHCWESIECGADNHRKGKTKEAKQPEMHEDSSYWNKNKKFVTEKQSKQIKTRKQKKREEKTNTKKCKKGYLMKTKAKAQTSH